MEDADIKQRILRNKNIIIQRLDKLYKISKGNEKAQINCSEAKKNILQALKLIKNNNNNSEWKEKIIKAKKCYKLAEKEIIKNGLNSQIDKGEKMDKILVDIENKDLINTNIVLPGLNANIRLPQEFEKPIDKITRLTFNGKNSLISDEIISLSMEKKGNKQITTGACIEFKKLPNNIKIPKGFNCFDELILWAVNALYRENGEYMTVQSIYRVLGNKNKRITSKQKEKILQSIYKLSNASILIQAEQEAKVYKMDTFNYYESILNASMAVAQASNGQNKDCIHVLNEPVLYRYARSKKQIKKYGIGILDAPLNKTNDVMKIQAYLIDRLSRISPTWKNSNIILYSNIYNLIDENLSKGTDAQARKKRTKTHKQVLIILNEWKKTKIILDYKEHKKGNKLYSISIEI